MSPATAAAHRPQSAPSSPHRPGLVSRRFFDAAARHQNFARAAEELRVTAAAVAYRVKTLEDHLGYALFERHPRGVRLSLRGKACLGEAQRLLADFRELIQRHRSLPQVRCLSILAVESVAERWLMPKLAGFRASWPDVAIKLETNQLDVDPNRHDFDVWIAYAGEDEAPSTDTTRRETLFEETMFPVCSPAFLESRRRPLSAVELHSWPLLYHLGWPADWLRWFASQGDPPPDLSRASGFSLYSMLLRAAVRPPSQGASRRCTRSANGSSGRPPTSAWPPRLDTPPAASTRRARTVQRSNVSRATPNCATSDRAVAWFGSIRSARSTLSIAASRWPR